LQGNVLQGYEGKQNPLIRREAGTRDNIRGTDVLPTKNPYT